MTVAARSHPPPLRSPQPDQPAHLQHQAGASCSQLHGPPRSLALQIFYFPSTVLPNLSSRRYSPSWMHSRTAFLPAWAPAMPKMKFALMTPSPQHLQCLLQLPAESQSLSLFGNQPKRRSLSEVRGEASPEPCRTFRALNKKKRGF